MSLPRFVVGAALVTTTAYLACDGKLEDRAGAADAGTTATDAELGQDTAAGDASGTDAASDAATNPAFDWAPRAPMVVPRTEHGAAAVDGKIYVIGGYSGSMLARVDVYDPATNAWTRKADLHTARRSFATGVIGGKIYVTSGMSFTDYNAVTWLTSTEVYDPAIDSWTDVAPCPIATDGNNVWGNRFVGGGVLNGQLYVLAFDANATTRNAMYVYDPATDVWTTKAAGAFGSGQFGAAALGGKLHVYVSPYFDPPPGRLWSWEPSSETWIIRPTVEPWRAAFLAAGARLYTVGGVTGSMGEPVLTNAVHEYDPATASWTPRGAIGVAREYAAAVETGGQVYVLGGDIKSVPSDLVEVGTPR